MFSFLGELIALATWLFQRGCWNLRCAAGLAQALPAERELLFRLWIGSCCFSRLESAAQWLAIGPPWDQSAGRPGCSIWPLNPAMVSIPSRRSIRS